MKKPIYIRDGRRFKRVEDHVGDFWTKEGLWQKERDKDCVGQCVKQDAEKYTIAMFKLEKIVKGVSRYVLRFVDVYYE